MKQASFDGDSLGEFLNRPVKIGVIEWSPGTTFLNTYEPWALWAQNSYIKKKLDNFRNFRGTLKVSFKINGSPFHYGKIMASYRPLQDASGLREETHTTATSAIFVSSMMVRSQRVNVKMDPHSDSGGCLCLPLIIPDNYVPVNDLSAWQGLGELTVETMMDLRTVSSSTDVVTITIFAQMEDIDLTVPTYSVAAQADDEQKEMSEGVISRPAAIVAKAAGLLESIPIIKPFASVTSIAASAVSQVASLFGYSRPSIVDVTRFIRRNPLGELAHTSGADNVNKLTMDPKQNVTVDPRVVGLDGTDEMMVKYIVERESYMSYFEWSQTDGVDTNLFWTAVYPQVAHVNTGTYSDVIAMTSLCYGSLPFSHWSGGLKYRLEVMASKWHKGRLRIVYDPISLTNATATDNYNTNFVKILDLAETRNFEFVVPWAQNTPYKQVHPGIEQKYYLDPVSGATTSTPGIVWHNGFIAINVVNELISNDTTADIRVNVYVSAADDYELQGPNGDAFKYFSPFPLAQADDEQTENMPDSAEKTHNLMTASPDITSLKDQVFFGDPIVSFRSLIKRYNLHMIMENPVEGSTDQHDTFLYSFRLPNYPEYNMYDPGAQFGATLATPLGAVPYTPAVMTMLQYLTLGYVCKRGGIRWKYKPTGPTTNLDVSRITSYRIYRVWLGLSANVAQNKVANAALSTTNRLINSIWTVGSNMFSGAWTGLYAANNTINTELPYYTGKRFQYAQNLNILEGLDADESIYAKHILDLQMTMPVTSEPESYKASISFEKWVAAADDYSLMYYQNAPMLYQFATLREVDGVYTPP